MMKRFAVLFLVFVCAAPPARAFRIMIDPGHGGIDSGASRGGVHESDLVLKVALKLRERLAREPRLEVQMTRQTDRTIPLAERVRKADASAADLLVSLHANSSPEGRAQGMELFFQNSIPADEDALYLANLENQSPATEKEEIAEVSRKNDVAAIIDDLHRQARTLASLKFSQTIVNSWKATGARGPVIKQAPFRMVAKTSMPSVLIEIGFITHAAEARKLASDEYQDEIADRLKEAILDYRARYGETAPSPTP